MKLTLKEKKNLISIGEGHNVDCLPSLKKKNLVFPDGTGLTCTGLEEANRIKEMLDKKADDVEKKVRRHD